MLQIPGRVSHVAEVGERLPNNSPALHIQFASHRPADICIKPSLPHISETPLFVYVFLVHSHILYSRHVT
jgi:hypothetical protein